MKILCWNLEYWNNSHKPEWLENCRETLFEIIEKYDIDVALLQEINPLKLLGQNLKLNESHRYEDIIDEGNIVGSKIIYHELFEELPKRYRNNLWGNSIIIKKSYKNTKCNIDYDDNKNYFGRNCLMSYTIAFEEEKITFINLYNKYNNEEKAYTMLDKY
jgi:endonuclease/exonuclease/phosphatase family metal-dependent hydrolase